MFGLATNKMTQKEIRRDQYIIFTNWTDRDFNGVWDKKIYPLKAGKSYELQYFLAEHFGRHLIDRELQLKGNEAWEKEPKQGLNYDDRVKLRERVERQFLADATLRQELMDKCVTVIPEAEQIDVVKPKEVVLKEVVLKRDERAKELEAKYGTGLDLQVNRKALEQFEEAKVE